jgi:hypothetical protein
MSKGTLFVAAAARYLVFCREQKHLFQLFHEIEYYKQFVESDVKMIISVKLHSNSWV